MNLNSIASIPNWHRYFIGFLVAIGAIVAALQADPAILPPALGFVAPYEPLVGLIVLVALGGTPRFQLPTGPGAPPVTSPPTPGEIPHG